MDNCSLLPPLPMIMGRAGRPVPTTSKAKPQIVG